MTTPATPRKQGSHVTERDRIRIHQLYNVGLRQPAISDKLGIPQRTISRILHGPITPPRRRQAAPLPTPTRRALINAATSGQLERRMPWKVIAARLGISEPYKRICQAFKLEGFGRFRAKKKPDVSAEARAKRIEWARRHEHWTLDQWRNVVFTDESAFRKDWGSSFVTRRIASQSDALHPDAIIRKQAGYACIHVWGAISWHHVPGPLLFKEPSLIRTWTSASYCQFIIPIIDHFFGYLRGLGVSPILMEDNACVHTARMSREARIAAGITRLDWPPYSPDLNPIENIWAIIKQHIASRMPRTDEELRDYIEEA